MSNKQPLPDIILDAVSGGTMTYQGSPVKDLKMNNDGITAIMGDGSSVDLKWNREILGKSVSAPGGLRDAMEEIIDKHMDFFENYELDVFVEQA